MNNRVIGGVVVAAGLLFLLRRRASAEVPPEQRPMLEGSNGSMWRERCYQVRVGDAFPDRSTRNVDWSQFVPGGTVTRCSYDPVCEYAPTSFPVVDPSGVSYTESQWVALCSAQAGTAPPGQFRDAPPFYDPDTGELREWSDFTADERAATEDDQRRTAEAARRRAAERREEDIAAIMDQLGLDHDDAELYLVVAGENTTDRARRLERLANIGALTPIAQPRHVADVGGRLIWSGAALRRIRRGLANWATLRLWQKKEAIRDWRALDRRQLSELFGLLPSQGYGHFQNPISFQAFLANWRPPPRLSLPGITVQFPAPREVQIVG